MIVSPLEKVLSFRYTYSISVADTLLTTWPIALLLLPISFSPTTVFVSNARPETNVSLSREAILLSFDSYIAWILTTSGIFNEISVSSTLNP